MLVIIYWKYILRYYSTQGQTGVQLGHLDNYDQLLKSNGVLDTYFQRIDQVLKETNVSYLSYEQMKTTDKKLLQEMMEKVALLREVQHQELLSIKNGQEIQHGCQQSCCWSQRKMLSFYNGEKTRFPTVLDRLSQIDFKLLADLYYGRYRIPDGIKLSRLTDDILPCLQNNTIIFVHTEELRRFFRLIHNKISVNYILITGDSDVSCPINLIGTHSRLLDEIFAGKTHILHWFALNCDLGTNEQWKKSKIFSCLPQGIDQWWSHRYYMQLAQGRDDSIHNKFLKTDDYWILTSFNIDHGPNYRKSLWNLSCNGRLKNISKCFYQLNSVDTWRFHMHVARSKFVFSPPGYGIDCYRTWEALYLGSIPIIINSPINSIFEKLPVLIVNNYEEINLQLLKSTYENMTRQSYDYTRLYKGYWQRQINLFRNSSEMIQYHYTSVKQ
ncbi:unnamed protein product [Adineta steineri]|uniref:Exostosin GT47 domain-containing protein n=1 Tax=Adineta steineri TaxID=433720 RepID=A0A815SZZ3_9BILA|nr:unnamed protein product [Adineta steineri]CAF0903879.1 unnamed protein product [Adineta steineri]CAF1498734.1 unnamed protein product [Adineta steineri]CAF3644333.1 unnamed protein product [Adineta steineri]CAF3934680.1 unnamed protein product [Adineta steineri]